MDDLNDLFFFTAVVRHKGFSAASRATGIEKTRLSRRIAALERHLGVSLLHRSTRLVTLTRAGERFYAHCRMVIEDAQSAYDSIDELKAEPTGRVRASCPIVLAQSYLAPILPGYMTSYPKVEIFIKSTNDIVDLIEDGFDVVFRASSDIGDSAHLVAKELGRASRIMVASPAFLIRFGRPQRLSDLAKFEIIGRNSDLNDRMVHWVLIDRSQQENHVELRPRLVTGDLRVQLEAAIHGVGVALLPEPIVSEALQSGVLEQVLPRWRGAEHVIHMLYPKPRGMLPSVRSFIDYLLIHMPSAIRERNLMDYLKSNPID